MSFYLKYRPQNFKSIMGQEHIITTLENALKHNSLTHAYLFSGPRGTGKTSLARIIAKSLNCKNLTDGIQPCDDCDNCRAILEGRLVDMIEIDAASNRGIDEIRDLKEKIQFAPTQGSCKVYIIDEVHMLTKEAFNALLKTLEEPPEHAYFILATTEVHKIPETIISRCQQFSFKRITQQVIVDRLKEIAANENIQAEPDALELIARQSAGGLRDAIGLFEQMNIDGAVIYQEVVNHLGITGHMLIESFFSALVNHEPVKAIELINQVNNQGQSLQQFCVELIDYLREQMLLGLNEKKQVGEIIAYIDVFSEAKQQINQATIPLLPLEVAIIKACQFDQVGQALKPMIKQEEVAEGVDPIPKQELQEEPVAEALADREDITLEGIKEKWQRIVDNIETPFIRMSFVDGEPVKFEEGKVHLQFRSSTLLDKVANPKNQQEILAAFETVLKSKVGLKLTMKKISISTVNTVKEEESKAQSPSVIEMAREIFGS